MRPDRLFSLVLALLLLAGPVRPAAAEALGRWLGQTVYVPVYSHIFADDRYRDRPFLLTATLSVRNTDPERPFTLRRVDYYDSEGALLQRYLEAPITLAPLASTHYIVPESEAKGGAGAKFLIEWQAPAAVSEPIIEAVMIGTKLQQGISFISTGRAIKGTPAR
ncbi:MAG: DUF3124 domain-containing protein [Desulfobulbus sp.]|jgi:hypothetical protein|nr:DUF3124 domain-containing protein [Desulfobulbus sp.]MBP8815907.1 DUF3124 domain-containing protein [Desulfobulbus sp.]